MDKIKDIHPGMKTIFLEAKVVLKEPEREIKSGIRCCKLHIEDDTGLCHLWIYKDVIDTIAEGNTIHANDVYCNKEWEGVMQVTMGKFGQVVVKETSKGAETS